MRWQASMTCLRCSGRSSEVLLIIALFVIDCRKNFAQTATANDLSESIGMVLIGAFAGFDDSRNQPLGLESR